ncbi:MAG: DUF1080 domain-containing protein [Bryobacterales bacterium]|nr:DUF1080 domain-containing protein [Bryobacterales bacterium]
MLHRLSLLLALSVPLCAQSPWLTLFDGKTLNGLVDPWKGVPPGGSWVIENGALKVNPKPRIAEDLVTEREYGDFELEFEWKVSPGGNTGVKYRIQRILFVAADKTKPGPGGFEGMLGREMANPSSDRAHLSPTSSGFEYTIGFECQLIDDERHPDARRDEAHKTGALYSFIPPARRAAKPAGEWNTARILVRGAAFEHWINGVQVLAGRLDDSAVHAGAAARWAAAPLIREMLTKPRPAGPITFQHHGDEVWFRAMRIRTF